MNRTDDEIADAIRVQVKELNRLIQKATKQRIEVEFDTYDTFAYGDLARSEKLNVQLRKIV